MTHTNAIRWLAHQARTCRDRDSSEAFCLLLPALMRILELEGMEDVEAAAFKHEFRQRLLALPFQDGADRAAQARPAVLARPMQAESSHEETEIVPGACQPRPVAPGSTIGCPA